jgi:ABC-type uncharacterized transport system permease subunit
MFISDLVIPAEFLPDWLQKIVPYLPGYAMVHLLRPSLTADIFTPETGSNLLIAAAYILVSGFIAVRFFRWAPAN